MAKRIRDKKVEESLTETTKLLQYNISTVRIVFSADSLWRG